MQIVGELLGRGLFEVFLAPLLDAGMNHAHLAAYDWKYGGLPYRTPYGIWLHTAHLEDEQRRDLYEQAKIALKIREGLPPELKAQHANTPLLHQQTIFCKRRQKMVPIDCVLFWKEEEEERLRTQQQLQQSQ